MFEKRYIEIKNPLPLKDQETACNRMRGERWRVDTSESAVARALQRRGYAPISDDGTGHYLRFELPANALTFRSLFALEDSRQAENLPKGSKDDEGSDSESPKVGDEAVLEPAIGEKDNR